MASHPGNDVVPSKFLVNINLVGFPGLNFTGVEAEEKGEIFSLFSLFCYTTAYVNNNFCIKKLIGNKFPKKFRIFYL